MPKSIKILLAEDEPSLGQIIKESLETRNFEVLLCEDGEKAYKTYKSEKPLLLVLDIMMPKKTGLKIGLGQKKILRMILLMTIKVFMKDVLIFQMKV